MPHLAQLFDMSQSQRRHAAYATPSNRLLHRNIVFVAYRRLIGVKKRITERKVTFKFKRGEEGTREGKRSECGQREWERENMESERKNREKGERYMREKRLGKLGQEGGSGRCSEERGKEVETEGEEGEADGRGNRLWQETYYDSKGGTRSWQRKAEGYGECREKQYKAKELFNCFGGKRNRYHSSLEKGNQLLLKATDILYSLLPKSHFIMLKILVAH